MKSHLQSFQYPWLFFLFIILHIPISPSKEEDRYSACNQTFECGDTEDIPYPFWGGNRPNYCGRPGFKLDCQYESLEINITSQTYLVLDIKQDEEILTIARKDMFDLHCLPEYRNASLNFTLFDYVPNKDTNLTLFYDCPLSIPDLLQCSPNSTYTKRYRFVFSSNTKEVKKLAECKNAVKLTVLEEPAMSLNNIGWTLENIQSVFREGFEVGYDGDVRFCNACMKSGGRCGYDWTLLQPTCYCPGSYNQTPCHTEGSNRRKIIGIATFTGGIGSIVIVGTIICYCLRRKSLTARKTESAKAVEAFLKDCALLTPKRYKFKEVKKMTSAFKDKIGQGGYGSVFKGTLPDGNMVAVKILSEKKGNGNEFINEVASISRTSHVNIVSLIGFCVDEPKRALVYEFMPNGSLEKFIFEGTPSKTHHQLCWETLYKIAIGIARGLEYLHRDCGTRIVHFDIKPHNILLDKNFNPKIADFGLSKLCHETESVVSMTRARGTAGYIAPEVVSRNFGVVSHKSDVYSYGMMVLEMVGGRRNLDARVSNISEIYFPHWVYKRLNLNEDLSLHGVTSLKDQEIAQKMILVGLWCIQIDPQNRPPMSRVLDMLAGRLEDLEIPPNPFPSSPLREEVS